MKLEALRYHTVKTGLSHLGFVRYRDVTPGGRERQMDRRRELP